MRKVLTFILVFCCLLLASSVTSPGQGKASRTTIPVAAESGNREQDGLNGPVRRVRVETAKITVKDGKLVEAARVLRGLATYDPSGKKIDSVAYPIEGSNLPGKEQYRYDEKGNIIEMVLLGDDGSTLSKETYEYEFDEVGNWKKMISSVAVYENGRVTFEPIEVTYRTIGYYYGQAIDKLASSAVKVEAGASPTGKAAAKSSKPAPVVSPGASSSTIPTVPKDSSVTSGGVGSSTTPATKNASVPQPSTLRPADAGSKTALAKDASTVPPVSTVQTMRADSSGPASEKPNQQTEGRVEKPADSESSSARSVEHQSKPAENVLDAMSSAVPPPVTVNATSPASEKVSINRVAEEKLRRAAINLPQPEYSPVAILARASGKVEVQIIVDEKGQVVAARATSGHPLLTDEAETAARKASFVRSKLSSAPGKIYGLITYNFEAPTTKLSSKVTPTNSPSGNTKPPRTEESSRLVPPEVPAASVPAQPNNTSNTADTATARHEGTPTDLPPNAKAETVAVLKQAVQANPNDAVAYMKLGMAYSARNEYKEAIPVFKMATRINPNDAIPFIKLGLAYSASNDYKNAVSAFKTAIRLSPDLVDAEAHYQLGNAYLAIGRYSDALEALKQALYIERAQVIDPNTKKALTLPPPDELHYSLGRAYHSVKNYREAIKELLEATSLNPSLAEGHFSLAIVYIDSGDPKAAEKQMNILRSLDQDLADRIAGLLSSKEPGRCRNGTGVCR